MALPAGTRLGPYEVTSHIGSGGMGEVYLARDTKLNRDVAIKVLPALFANDPERLARFEREAQTLALLNHPNIAQIYGVVDKPPALVMELVDGEDLAARLARGPLPIDEALAIGKQIAEALDAAHERGIVHRDLKPANVKLRGDGAVKVLDFGLAKAMDPAASADTSNPPLANSPTFTSPAHLRQGVGDTARLRQGFGEAGTEMGLILGTAAYMSPEQARGRPVDKRTDIWAFGGLFYELLTAKQPFGGETVTDTLAAIVKEEPDWTALPSSTPPSLRRLMQQCLVKDPRQRLRDIGDARIAIDRMIAGAAEDRLDLHPALDPGSRFAAGHLVAGALTFGLAVALVTWLVARPAPPEPPPLVSFAVPIPDDVPAARATGSGVTFSRDGKTVVYVAQPAGQSVRVLYRRRLGSPDVEPLAGTAGGYAPFFSWDGRSIGYFLDSAVMKMSLEGGGATKVCDRGRFSRADWGADDTIVLGTSQVDAPGALAKVSAAGGTPQPLTSLTGQETLHQLPHFLPDGRHLLFSALAPGRGDIEVTSIDDGAHRALDLEGSGAVFVAPDHLLYARGDALFAVPFDARGLRVTGSPVHVLDEAGTFLTNTFLTIPMVAVDGAGSVAYLNKRAAASALAWVGPGAATSTIPIPPALYRTLSLSPDGRRATVAGFPVDVWVIDLARGTRLRLTANTGVNPIWSPDGLRIAYRPTTDAGIVSVAADGSGAPEVVVPPLGAVVPAPTSWSPDGATVVFTAEDRTTVLSGARNRDIWSATRGAKPAPIVNSPADEYAGMVSPDGKWLAYVSNASGRDEVYVRPFGSAGGTIPVSNEGGTSPMWAPGGGAVFFLNGAKIMRASVTGVPAQIGAPVVARTLPAGGVTAVAVAGDDRFLVLLPETDTAPRDVLHVLLNWGRTLK